MRIAILALQGAFEEHRRMLQKMGIDSFFVRNSEDWKQSKDGLIIPGGESTTMLRLIRELNLFAPVKQAIEDGLPVFGTCAGLIMLDGNHLGTMDIEVKRNAYGRQLGSFVTQREFRGIGNITMTFIRAPYITHTGDDVEVLAEVDGHVVAAKQGHQLVTSFHPELNESTAVHKYFLEMCRH